MLLEYQARLAARDPDVLDASRDWGDNDGAPWRLEVFVVLGFLILFVSVAVLVALFMGVKALTGG